MGLRPARRGLRDRLRRLRRRHRRQRRQPQRLLPRHLRWRLRRRSRDRRRARGRRGESERLRGRARPRHRLPGGRSEPGCSGDAREVRRARAVGCGSPPPADRGLPAARQRVEPERVRPAHQPRLRRLVLRTGLFLPRGERLLRRAGREPRRGRDRLRLHARREPARKRGDGLPREAHGGLREACRGHPRRSDRSVPARRSGVRGATDRQGDRCTGALPRGRPQTASTLPQRRRRSTS